MKASAAPAIEHQPSSQALHAGKQGNTPFFGPAAENEAPFFAPRIQTKLSIGQPGDKYEQEADAVADRVVQRLANPGAPIAVQKKCQDCEEKEKLQRKEEEREEPVVMRQVEDEQGETPPVQAKAEKEEEEPKVMRQTENEQEDAPPVQAKEKEEEEKPGIMRQAGPEEEEPLQAKAEAGASSTPSLQSRLSSAKGSGAQMDKSARAPMEAAFGQDFGRVRIHTDGSSAQMNRELNARAFTHGRDIYFNAGEYSPGSTEGRRLLAHELVHVGQQGGREIDGNSHDNQTIAHKENNISKPNKSKNVGKINSIEKWWHDYFGSIQNGKAWTDENQIRSAFPMNKSSKQWNYKLLVESFSKLYYFKQFIAALKLLSKDKYFSNFVVEENDKETLKCLLTINLYKIIGKEEDKYEDMKKCLIYFKVLIDTIENKITNEKKDSFTRDTDFLNRVKKYSSLKTHLIEINHIISVSGTINDFALSYLAVNQYLNSLGKLTGDNAVRALIEYQKLMVTTNVKWESDYDPKTLETRRRPVEQTQGESLEIVNWISEWVLGRNGKLTKAVMGRINLGYSGAAATTYLNNSTDLTQHIKGKSLNRQGWRHRYGALDILSGAGKTGQDLNYHFRREIFLDELPDTHEVLENKYFQKDKNKLILVEGKIHKNPQKTSTESDLGNRFLDGFVRSKRETRMIEKISESFRDLRALWAALYFEGTSAIKMPGDKRLRRAIQNIRGYFGNIENLSRERQKLNPSGVRYGSISLESPPPAYTKGFSSWKGSIKYVMDLLSSFYKNKYSIHDSKYRKFNKENRMSIYNRYIKQGYSQMEAMKALNKDLERYSNFAMGQAINETMAKLTSEQKNDLNNIYRYLNKINTQLNKIESIFNSRKSKDDYRSMNTVYLQLVYKHGDIKVLGQLSFAHLYDINPIIKKDYTFYDNKIAIGKMGTTGESVVPHVHISGDFYLYKKGDPLLEEPCSPVVFLGRK